MGDPEYYKTSNPVFAVMMRNSRSKMFVYVGIVGTVCFIVFMLSSTHNSLKELEGVNEKCQQQRDSLSAQLQVVYEHKNRLEKSLQQEKTDHKHTKEANEKQASEFENKFQKEKDEREKLVSQVSQLKNNYLELEEEKMQAENTMKDQLKSIQSQKDKEIEKLQTHISDLLAEKEKLETTNNELDWKLKQHDSEANLCSLQLVQAKNELQTCQEKVKNAANGIVVEQGAAKDPPVAVASTNNQSKLVPLLENQAQPQDNIVLPQANQDLPINNEILPQIIHEHRSTELNKTASQPALIRASVLEKPHIMPSNNLGEGVLPKPMDPKPDEAPKEIDAAIEVVDYKRNERQDDLAILNNNIEDRVNLLNDEKKVDQQNNHPQVAPPHLENADDNAAERGEDGNQYHNPDAKHQVEVPDIKKQLPKESQQLAPVAENNDIAAQKNDMMNKSPGDVHNVVEQNVIGIPPAAGIKNREFMHRGADVHRVIDDKNYEEDDDERDNDDEPPNGLAPMVKGVNNLMQDNDFDDQENPDNLDNAKEEEGVVVAPK